MTFSPMKFRSTRISTDKLFSSHSIRAIPTFYHAGAHKYSNLDPRYFQASAVKVHGAATALDPVRN